MLVLVAPDCDDPLDGGFNHCHPGELLTKRFVCDAGRRMECDCGYVFDGVSSQKATTIALVEDRDLTLEEYRAIIRDDGEESDELADWLLRLVAPFSPGDLVVTQFDDPDTLTVDRLDDVLADDDGE